MDAVGGHFLHHVPGHVVGVAFVKKVGGQEDGGGEAIFFEDGEGVLVVVQVAVVEGDDDGFGGQVCFTGDGAGQIVEADGGVAVFGQVLHLAAEIVGRDGEIGAVDVGIFGGDADIVVHEDRNAQGPTVDAAGGG